MKYKSKTLIVDAIRMVVSMDVSKEGQPPVSLAIGDWIVVYDNPPATEFMGNEEFTSKFDPLPFVNQTPQLDAEKVKKILDDLKKTSPIAPLHPGWPHPY